MDYIAAALRQNPELAIFLTIAIGFLIGRIKFRSFSLGIVVGCLFAGVLIGQLDIKVPPLVKTIFFDLFLFTTGYKVGPQFFRGLERRCSSPGGADGSAVRDLSAHGVRILEAPGLRRGNGGGTSGGRVLGVDRDRYSGQAIQRLALPEAEKAALINNIPVAYAVTYLIGTAALVWFLPTIGPKLMGINLREEAERMRSQSAGSGDTAEGVTSAARAFDVRAYRVTNPNLFNRTIAQLEMLPE